MSSVLTRSQDETSSGSTNDASGSMMETMREPLLRTLETALEESGTGSDGSRGGIARTFLLIDLGAALGYLRGRRSASEVVETFTAPNDGSETKGMRDAISPTTEAESGGRSARSTLLLAGLVVGLTYLLRSRSASVDRAVGTVTGRARSVADTAARRSGEAAQRTESAADEAADRIEQTGEAAAEQVREGGETAADRVQESGEMAEERIDEAADAAEEVEEQAEQVAGDGSDENEE